MVKTRKGKCPICEQRPKNGGRYCTVCEAKISKDKRLRKLRNARAVPDMYLSYRGWIVALSRNTENHHYDGKLMPNLTPETLPAKVPHVNLDVWHPEYSRDQVKRLKAELLRLVGAYSNPSRCQNN